MKKSFRARLQSEEPRTCFFELPFDVKATFGKARPPVVVTIGRHSWRSTVSVYGGRSLLPMRKSNQEAAGVAAGDDVDVVVALDEAPRVVPMPKELKGNAKAQAGWNALSFSHQREHAEALADAKKPETRARRVQKMIAMLLSASAAAAGSAAKR